MPDEPKPMVEIVVSREPSTEIFTPLLPASDSDTAQTPDCSEPIHVQTAERRGRAVRIADALRREGLDELEVARRLAELIERLSPKSDLESRSDKMLIDALKEVVRLLNDAPRGNQGRQPVSIQLVHSVPRPKRASKPRKQHRKDVQDERKS